MGVGSRICPELSLDCSSSSKDLVPKPIVRFLEEASRICSVSEKITKLDEYVNGLQDEMKKIYGFKKELPLCMLLLNDAIAMMKDELMKCKKSNTEPLPKEYIRLEKDEKFESVKQHNITNVNDKRNWKNSLQLGNLNNKHHFPKPDSCDNKQMSKLDNTKKRAKEEGEDELCLGLSPKASCSRSGSSSAIAGGSNSKGNRKQRRSWSPDLHHRFLEALSKLGGARAATPRLIRENMGVDDLTLDQVKSHLQKYRIHTKKTTPSTDPFANTQAAGLRGLRMPMPQEPLGKSLKPSNSQSGSPHGPFLLAGSSLGTSTTGGDSMRDEDDGNSEIHSWKSQLHLSGRYVP